MNIKSILQSHAKNLFKFTVGGAIIVAIFFLIISNIYASEINFVDNINIVISSLFAGALIGSISYTFIAIRSSKL